MIDLKELNYKDFIGIDINVPFNEEIYVNSKVKGLNDVHTKGKIFYDETDNYYALLDVKGTMILADTITLEDIPYDFEFEIDDNIPETCINKQNILDLSEFLWQNIVLEVPIRYTKSDAKNLKGDHWEVIDSEKVNKEENPELAKLKDLYKGGE